MSKKNDNPEETKDIEAGELEAGNTEPSAAEAGQDADKDVQDVGSEPTIEQQLEQAREEAEKHKESFLLASAEAENIRKRAQNEIATARKFAIDRFASELLSVRDSLDLASATDISSDGGDAMEKMHEGLALTLKQLDAVFEKFNISVIDPKGEKFNPDHHQAMTAVESPDLDPNHVVDVMQKGYLLNDRLLRPAMVVVSKAPAEKPSAEDAAEQGK